MDGTSYLHQLMWGLYYPAVLGTICYSLIDYVGKKREQFHITKLALTFLVVMHFSLDYVAVKRVMEYSSLSFFIDLIVVIALFSAFYYVRLANPEIEPSFFRLCISMGVAYVLYAAWTLHNLDQISPSGWVVAFDITFALLYFGVAWIRPRRRLVVFLLLLNCICYYFIIKNTQVGVQPG